MDFATALVLALFLIPVSLLYSAVGQGGASGYLAVMALVGVAPETMRPLALALNIVVSSIALVSFYRSGAFSFRLFLAFAGPSVPMAFVGGLLSLPSHIYQPVVGIVFLGAATRLFREPSVAQSDLRTAPLFWSAFSGGSIGLVSGLTGLGGGILLAPLVLMMRWAGPRETAGLSSGFILANSIAALLGVAGHEAIPVTSLPLFVAAVAAGGWVGSRYGSRRLRPETLRRILALVLVVASVRLFVL
jgi:uncharacterized membrane protein YfcA